MEKIKTILGAMNPLLLGGIAVALILLVIVVTALTKRGKRQEEDEDEEFDFDEEEDDIFAGATDSILKTDTEESSKEDGEEKQEEKKEDEEIFSEEDLDSMVDGVNGEENTGMNEAESQAARMKKIVEEDRKRVREDQGIVPINVQQGKDFLDTEEYDNLPTEEEIARAVKKAEEDRANNVNKETPVEEVVTVEPEITEEPEEPKGYSYNPIDPIKADPIRVVIEKLNPRVLSRESDGEISCYPYKIVKEVLDDVKPIHAINGKYEITPGKYYISFGFRLKGPKGAVLKPYPTNYLDYGGLTVSMNSLIAGERVLMVEVDVTQDAVLFEDASLGTIVYY